MTIYDLSEYRAVECFHGGTSNLSIGSNTPPRTAVGLQDMMTIRVVLAPEGGRTSRVLLLVELW